MKHGRLTFADFSRTWRIWVAVLIFQLVGSAIGLVVAPHHFWFMNLWLGGVIGTLPGFVLGFVWHSKSSTGRENREWVARARCQGLGAIAFTVLALGLAIPTMRSEMKSLNALNRLQPPDVQKIEVFDEDGKKRLAEITDPESLTAFAQGITDAVGHSPNHPHYTHSWYVVVNGPVTHEFELHINPRYPSSVIGYFVKKSESGNATWYHGTFQSKDLRPWAQSHLLPLDAADAKANTNASDFDIDDIFRATVPASNDSSPGRAGQ